MGRFGAAVRAFRGESQVFAMADVSTGNTEETKNYVGNEYRTYSKIIKAIAEKYQAKASWGCQPTGNIIDVRSAFIIGQGVTVSPVDPADAESEEMKFAKDFFEYNALDREAAQEFVKEAEIEGCFLGVLEWVDRDEGEKDKKGKRDGQVSLRFVSRVETSYEVAHPKNDYAKYERVTFGEGSGRKDLESDSFVYARFGGRLHKPNEPTPKVGKCLTEIEGLNKALRDWREINNLFAAPVPYIECQTAEQAKYMASAIEDAAKNWKLKKLIVLSGKIGYLVPTENGGLEKEIVTLAKIISGATGVPVHFLGLPDLMSNRATAENLMELVAASTSKERLIWHGAFQEILAKAMKLRNAQSALTKLDASKVKVSIPYITAEAWQRIVDIYLPLYDRDAIDRSTLLAQVPGINVEEEMKKAKKREAENLKKFTDQTEDEDENEDEETP